jgi:hypothetical protein
MRLVETYRYSVDKFFEKLLYFKHISGRVSHVLNDDIEKYTSEEAIIRFASALVISDISGPTDNGWEINFHTGVTIETQKEDYEIELNKISSKQRCLLFAQSFEAFERFLKDCLFERSQNETSIKEYAQKLMHPNQRDKFSRVNFPTGDNLWRIMKRAGGFTFDQLSSHNNLESDFNVIWKVLSKCRHSITHNEGILADPKILSSLAHYKVLQSLFNINCDDNGAVELSLDKMKFDRTIKRFAEFAYQVYKALVIEEDEEPYQ